MELCDRQPECPREQRADVLATNLLELELPQTHALREVREAVAEISQ